MLTITFLFLFQHVTLARGEITVYSPVVSTVSVTSVRLPLVDVREVVPLVTQGNAVTKVIYLWAGQDNCAFNGPVPAITVFEKGYDGVAEAR